MYTLYTRNYFFENPRELSSGAGLAIIFRTHARRRVHRQTGLGARKPFSAKTHKYQRRLYFIRQIRIFERQWSRVQMFGYSFTLSHSASANFMVCADIETFFSIFPS